MNNTVASGLMREGHPRELQNIYQKLTVHNSITQTHNHYFLCLLNCMCTCTYINEGQDLLVADLERSEKKFQVAGLTYLK